MANKYWVGGSGNWSDAANHWASSSGGTPGSATVPTSVDDVFFDSASHTTSYTVTMNSLTLGRDVTINAPASGNVTLAGSSTGRFYGSVFFYSGLINAWTGSMQPSASSGSFTINTNSVPLLNTLGFTVAGAIWTFTGNFVGTRIIHTQASLDTNGYSITLSGDFDSINTNVRTLNLGTSIIICSTFNYSTTNLTISSAQAKITFRNDFRIGASSPLTTYYFDEITLDKTTVVATNNIQGTITCNKFSVINNTIAFTILFYVASSPNYVYSFGEFNVSGVPGGLITINSSNVGITHNLVKITPGNISCNYLDISHSIATPSNRWYAGYNSVNNQGAAPAGTGWIFTSPSNPNFYLF